MNIQENLKKVLPQEIKLEDLQELVSKELWKSNPEQATIIAIKRLDVFDNEKYKNEYIDINHSNIDPIEHYIRYGINEGRKFFKRRSDMLKYKKMDNNKLIKKCKKDKNNNNLFQESYIQQCNILSKLPNIELPCEIQKNL